MKFYFYHADSDSVWSGHYKNYDDAYDTIEGQDITIYTEEQFAEVDFNIKRLLGDKHGG